jgi:chromosome segregation protein
LRLTHVKLSGFKSFVDPTSIPVPGQLVAVIGPNGCGKSNVIDAVRWVLGESSAKQLRGESMQDVIFNGSSTRKPVSRASVELVFDNADGQLTGPWGQYAEVAIKRVLTRQGESSYYINNQQVRRRDITDLFLGTGVVRVAMR